MTRLHHLSVFIPTDLQLMTEGGILVYKSLTRGNYSTIHLLGQTFPLFPIATQMQGNKEIEASE